MMTNYQSNLEWITSGIKMCITVIKKGGDLLHLPSCCILKPGVFSLLGSKECTMLKTIFVDKFYKYYNLMLYRQKTPAGAVKHESSDEITPLVALYY